MDSVTLAEVLSPSQISQFLNCPARWMFRYLLDFKDPGTAATALGTAFHETIAHNFRQKRETARDLPLAECLEFFRNALGRQLETIRLQRDEHPMEVLELGETMIAKYIEEAAPSIQPAVVESRVSGLIGGVKVSGYVDLLDTEGRLIDSKSSPKPIKGIAHDHRLQLTSYAIDHAGCQRRLPHGHRDEGKDRHVNSKELLRQRKGQAVCRSGLSQGARVDPRLDIPAATKQFGMFKTILRLLGRL
jgi:RecB family exonuclease